jgi:PST family polysaccharide transporter
MSSVSLPADSGASHKTSYAQILHSSAVVGGASVLNILIGLLRVKALALLLGPVGIGLFGIFTSVSDLARSVAQMGVRSSGVRQIAESAATGDMRRLARTVLVLRRTIVVLGLMGTVGLAALSGHVSRWAFGTESYSTSVAWLSLTVFFGLIADGQGALMQGMRRIADLARIGVLGTLAGAVVSVALAIWFGDGGIVPGLVMAAAVSTLISWWYARAVAVEPVMMRKPEILQEAGSLLKLGVTFMVSALLMTGAAFLVRAMVLRSSGLEAAGLYQAAWTLGGIYVGIVLQAMGTDFYPRLVGAIGDKERANRMVNEQTRVSLLLAGPGVTATLALATPALTVLYSAEFSAATDTLRWICLGMALRVITWPVGYIIVAKNRRAVFFGAELAWTVVNVGLSWICIRHYGLVGAGMAFCGSYVFHGLMVYPIARRLTGFGWSTVNRRTGLLYLAVTALAFAGFSFLSAFWAAALAAALTVVSGVYSARELAKLTNPSDLPSPLRRLVQVLLRNRAGEPQ